MDINKLKISQVAINAANPRAISGTKFDKLVASILVLPKMLELRPVVIDNTNTVIGGNMRVKALNHIAEMDIADIERILTNDRTYQLKSEVEQSALIEWWKQWISSPCVPIVYADKLTEQEQREFVIKDNASFGEWDWDMLANEWNEELLKDWGVDVPIIEDYTDDDSDNSESEEEQENGYKIAYELVFNNEDEQTEFYDLLRELKNRIQDYDTISERMLFALKYWRNNYE